MPSTFPCPNCGDDVPAGALACPHCGADEETGWSDEASYGDLDIPTGYSRSEERYGGDYERSTRPKDIFWKIVGAILAAILILLALWGVW